MTKEEFIEKRIESSEIRGQSAMYSVGTIKMATPFILKGEVPDELWQGDQWLVACCASDLLIMYHKQEWQSLELDKCLTNRKEEK